MPRIATAIKALSGAIEKEELPTLEDITEIQRLVAQLTEMMIPDDDDDSSSGEDVSSVEESSDEDDESDSESTSSESSERRSYKKGPRAKGYALYIKNGGTRAKWAEKSDKYKDSYYERKK